MTTSPAESPQQGTNCISSEQTAIFPSDVTSVNLWLLATNFHATLDIVIYISTALILVLPGECCRMHTCKLDSLHPDVMLGHKKTFTLEFNSSAAQLSLCSQASANIINVPCTNATSPGAHDTTRSVVPGLGVERATSIMIYSWAGTNTHFCVCRALIRPALSETGPTCNSTT